MDEGKETESEEARRRSRTDTKMAREPHHQPPATRLILPAVTLFTVALLYLLLPQLHHDIAKPLIAITGGSQQEGHAANSDSKFKLHPEDHVYRNASTFTHHWCITSGDRRPDGVLKHVYLVNNDFPGPILEARPGDRLTITVQNALEDGEGLSLHWHGLYMRGANEFDGASGITQSPIEAGTSFTYDFVVDWEQHGTFWWHAHDGVQRADGLYGGLVVHDPAQWTDNQLSRDEHLLLIGDWYHRPAEDALRFYMHPGAFGLETVPDSVLVNGRGLFNCSDAVPARPLDCQTIANPSAIRLYAEKRSLLRIVNVGAYAGFSVSAPGFLMQALAVDGDHEIQGSPSRSLGVLHPGERVTALIEPEAASRAVSEMLVTLDEDSFKYQNLALTSTRRFPISLEGRLKESAQMAQGAYELQDLQSISAAHNQSQLLPEKVDSTIVLYAITQKLAILENEPHGFINHTRWIPSSTPLLELSPREWDEFQFVPLINYNEDSPAWVDIVLNNLDEESHPFHLHGHDFWVLSKHSSSLNWGSYNPFEDEQPPGGAFNIAGAVRKDTVHVPRRGYAVLRFRADNPGIWMFHCHVLWHQASGMSMAFEVR